MNIYGICSEAAWKGNKSGNHNYSVKRKIVGIKELCLISVVPMQTKKINGVSFYVERFERKIKESTQGLNSSCDNGFPGDDIDRPRSSILHTYSYRITWRYPESNIII